MDKYALVMVSVTTWTSVPVTWATMELLVRRESEMGTLRAAAAEVNGLEWNQLVQYVVKCVAWSP